MVRSRHFFNNLLSDARPRFEFLRRKVGGDLHEAARRQQIDLRLDDLISQLTKRGIKICAPQSAVTELGLNRMSNGSENSHRYCVAGVRVPIK